MQDESSLSDIYLIVNWHNDYIQLDLYKIMMERYVHVRATCIGVRYTLYSIETLLLCGN